jgi:hypothetical protein
MQAGEAQLEPFVREYYRELYKLGDATSTLIEPRVGREPGMTLIIMGIIGLLVLPVGIALFLVHFTRVSMYRKRRDGIKRAATQGRLRAFEPVMINQDFLDGKVEISAGLFMGVADNGAPLDKNAVTDALVEVQFAEEGSRISRMLADERFELFRRRLVPLRTVAAGRMQFFDMSLVRARHAFPLSSSQEFFAMVDPGLAQNAAFFVPDVIIEYARRRAAGENVPMPTEPLLAAP